MSRRLAIPWVAFWSLACGGLGDAWVCQASFSAEAPPGCPHERRAQVSGRSAWWTHRAANSACDELREAVRDAGNERCPGYATRCQLDACWPR